MSSLERRNMQPGIRSYSTKPISKDIREIEAGLLEDLKKMSDEELDVFAEGVAKLEQNEDDKKPSN